MSEIENTVIQICRAARSAGRELATLSTTVKNDALRNAAEGLKDRAADLLEANRTDLEAGRAAGLSEALIDRLALTESRVCGIAAGLEAIADLPDPVGETIRRWRRPNGLEISQVRIPLGVVGVI